MSISSFTRGDVQRLDIFAFDKDVKPTVVGDQFSPTRLGDIEDAVSGFKSHFNSVGELSPTDWMEDGMIITGFIRFNFSCVDQSFDFSSFGFFLNPTPQALSFCWPPCQIRPLESLKLSVSSVNVVRIVDAKLTILNFSFPLPSPPTFRPYVVKCSRKLLQFYISCYMIRPADIPVQLIKRFRLFSKILFSPFIDLSPNLAASTG